MAWLQQQLKNARPFLQNVQWREEFLWQILKKADGAISEGRHQPFSMGFMGGLRIMLRVFAWRFSDYTSALRCTYRDLAAGLLA